METKFLDEGKAEKRSKQPWYKEFRLKWKHCGEFLDTSKDPHLTVEKIQWYFRKSFIIITVFCVGPLALPLIWWHPQMTMTWKIVLTIGTLAVSWVLFQTTMESSRTLPVYFFYLRGIFPCSGRSAYRVRQHNRSRPEPQHLP